MKHRRLVIRICTAIAIVAGLFSIGHAQNREKFGISAKAGGVNAVIGQVWVKRAGEASQQRLTTEDDLSSGDVVSTGVWARAEILLNPGSYLRLGEDSEFELVDSSLDNLRIKLIKGSAILEAIGGEQTELRITIVTAQQPLVIVRRGLYRINAQAGSTELLVQKGRVQVGNNPLEVVKGGKKIVVTGGSLLIAKIGKYGKDEFDNWSKQRGETLAQANVRLSRRTMSGYTALNSWGFGSGFGRLGLWTYNTSYRCFTFLPFYYGFSSVYGFYGSFYDLPGIPGNGCCHEHINRSPVIANNPSWPGGSSGGSSGGSGGSSGGSGGSGGSSGGSSPPSSPRPPSQAGPRDPDSGGRAINRIKDPIN
jgi:uncharacterized membrane protein YgcG